MDDDSGLVGDEYDDDEGGATGKKLEIMHFSTSSSFPSVMAKPSNFSFGR